MHIKTDNSATYEPCLQNRVICRELFIQRFPPFATLLLVFVAEPKYEPLSLIGESGHFVSFS